MIPSAINSVYPKFVPNQVLTSDNLNELFGYLDEQQRITRTNLLGIGIVCGLQVKTGSDSDGNYIIITKGTGVTSSGYLITVPEIKYHQYNTFNAVRCDYYDRFVNISDKTQKMLLWELKQLGEIEDLDNPFKKLNDPAGFLNNKVVMIFVELLEKNNKNCDPNSCDDKGINVEVNFRPLLIDKANAVELLNGAGNPGKPWLALPEIALKRFDVKATPIFECLNIFNAYRKILNNNFLTDIQSALTEAYNILNPVLADEFPSNPFSTLAADFKFLTDNSITTDQLITIQYYYDLFSDIILAYREFREKGMEFIGICLPDDSFPRHLLLDLAIPDASKELSSNRHYFIPSPILNEQQKTIAELKVLFKRLALLIPKFAVPSMSIQGARRKVDENIRITPSMLGNMPLSTKSIPYYYPIQNAADALLKNWSPEKLLQNKVTRNLSYHAVNYNASNDEIRNPLAYDLENYNFLRIEGHIGKPYQHVVKHITDIRNQNRLPFDIVALSADVTSITAFIKELGKMLTSGNTNPQATLKAFTGSSCHFNDLEALFDSMMTELTGKLSNELKFFYDLRRDQKRPPLADHANNIPQVPLLVKTDATFRFTNNSIGHEFEEFYPVVKNLPFIPIQVFFQSFGQGGNNDLMDFVFKAVLYYIEMLYERVATDLSNFSFFDFNFRYFTLIFTVRFIKALNKFNSELFPLSEEENDHLDAILSIVIDGRVAQLYFEFLKRVLEIKIMQQAGYYAICHPGIQHKAGVPVGGTFIVVYHEAEEEEEDVVVTNVAGVAGIATASTIINENRTFAGSAASGLRAKAEAAPIENLHVFAANIEEKVFFAKDKVEAGLKRSFKTDFSRGGKTKTDVAAPAGEKAVAADEAAPATLNSQQNLQGYFAAAALYLKNRKDDALDEAIADISDGAVIADFYLPYLCCSDCPPIQMIVNTAPEAENEPPVAVASTETPAITLDDGSAVIHVFGEQSFDPDGTIAAYKWSLSAGSASGVSFDAPDSASTDVKFTEAGEYSLKLTVTDNLGATNSTLLIITVTEKQEVIKTCGPLADIINEFNNWNKLVRKNPGFKEFFPSYGDVQNYFKLLSGILIMPVDQQIDFFSNGFKGIAIQDLLIKWMNELQEIIRERKDFRLLALMLYRILNQLSMYIVCIQDSDYNQAKVPMVAVFDLITEHAGEWVVLINQGNFSEEEISIVKEILKDIDKEIDRVIENGEETIKVNYLEVLRKIRDILLSIFGS
jgi:hypothetical protein